MRLKKTYSKWARRVQWKLRGKGEGEGVERKNPKVTLNEK